MLHDERHVYFYTENNQEKRFVCDDLDHAIRKAKENYKEDDVYPERIEDVHGNIKYRHNSLTNIIRDVVLQDTASSYHIYKFSMDDRKYSQQCDNLDEALSLAISDAKKGKTIPLEIQTIDGRVVQNKEELSRQIESKETEEIID